MTAFLALTAVLTAANGAANRAGERVLVMDLEAVSVSAQDADAATRLVTAAAAEVKGVVVMSSVDLRRLASLEADRFNAGCDNDSSCLAELAGALGAERVLYGSMSRLGSTTTVALSLYDAATMTVARRSFDVADNGALPALLRSNTTALLQGDVDTPRPARSSPVLGAATLGTGLGLVVLGGVSALTAEYGFVQDPNADGGQKPTWQAVGVGCVIAAGVGVVVALTGGALMAGGM